MYGSPKGMQKGGELDVRVVKNGVRKSKKGSVGWRIGR